MADTLDVQSIFRLKVDELKAELGKRGLTKGGSKVELQERLLKTLHDKVGTIDDDQQEEIDETTEDELLNNEELEQEEEEEAATLEDEALEHDDDEPQPNGDEEKELADEDLAMEDDIEVSMEEEIMLSTEHSTPEASKIDVILKEKSPVSRPVAIKRKAPPIQISAPNATVTEEITAEEVAAKPKPAKILMNSTLDAEKKLNRTQRFGVATNEDFKKTERSERFKSEEASVTKSSPTSEASKPTPVLPAEDGDRIKKRAERFGPVATAVVQSADKDKLTSRKERFADDKMKSRQERFGAVAPSFNALSNDMEARKQARALKFGAKT